MPLPRLNSLPATQTVMDSTALVTAGAGSVADSLTSLSQIATYSVANLPGSLLFASDNVYDIGASSANRPKTIYIAKELNLGSVAWVRKHPGHMHNKADVTNATATMSSLTDLSVTLVSGKRYSGMVLLLAQNSVTLEGLQFDFNGGSASTTNFFAGFSAVPPGTGIVLGTVTATALSTTLTVTTATATTMPYLILLTVLCNAGGTFIPRFAEVSHVTGTATVSQGSFIRLEEAGNS
ncbi:MAG: hypothetical protein KGL39_00190 [Patescibacteria group bacterium]|nr:hypothetical protein [Patescibacteria group bacterium]